MIEIAPIPRRLRLRGVALCMICTVAWCQLAEARSALSRRGESQVGTASYYSDRFQGRKTASGERYDRNRLTAVHRFLPFGSIVRVTNLANERSIVVRINDRFGHAPRGRLVDLSRSAARQLGMLHSGLARVRIEVLRLGDG